MDLAEDYIRKNQSNNHKPKASHFFMEYEKLITQMNYYEFMDGLSYTILKR